MLRFMKSIFSGIKDTIITTVKDIIFNIEAVVILCLASVGITFLLSELPFIISVPLFIESIIVIPMVLPFISIMIITGLVFLMNWRFNVKECKC